MTYLRPASKAAEVNLPALHVTLEIDESGLLLEDFANGEWLNQAWLSAFVILCTLRNTPAALLRTSPSQQTGWTVGSALSRCCCPSQSTCTSCRSSRYHPGSLSLAGHSGCSAS